MGRPSLAYTLLYYLTWNCGFAASFGSSNDIRRKLLLLQRSEYFDSLGGILGAFLIPGTASAADAAMKDTGSMKKLTPMMKKMADVFPGAVSNSELVRRLTRSLGTRGFRRETTFLATSLCCDELSRALEEDVSRAFGGSLYFRLGGLAGFPSAGVTGFGAMSEHIPDEGGTCLIVYGPHCGMDALGRVGTVPRKGKLDGGPCCGSAAAAAEYVMRNSLPPTATDALDVQQASVVSHLLPFADRVRSASVPMEEVPYCLFESQDNLMHQVVSRGRSRASNIVPTALLGGIAINTPPSVPDFFLPLKFDLYGSSIGREPEDLLSELEGRRDLGP